MTVLTVTNDARRLVWRLLTARGAPTGGLRIAVAPGAPPDTYDLTPRHDPEPGDTVLDARGVRLFLAPRAAAALAGGRIDADRGYLVLEPAGGPRPADGDRPLVAPAGTGPAAAPEGGSRRAGRGGWPLLGLAFVVVWALFGALAGEATEVVWPVPAPERLHPVGVRGPAHGESCGIRSGTCELRIDWDGQTRHLRYDSARRGGQGAQIREALRSGELVELRLGTAPGGPLAGDVWEVRGAGRTLLRHDEVVDDLRQARGRVVLLLLLGCPLGAVTFEAIRRWWLRWLLPAGVAAGAPEGAEA